MNHAEPVTIDVPQGVLKAARKRVGLSVGEAASLLSTRLVSESEQPITATELTAWESSARNPTLAQAEVAASVYLVPFVALAAGELPRILLRDFRLRPGKSAASLSYATLTTLGAFGDLYQLARRVVTALGMAESDLAVPRLMLPDNADSSSVERVASDIRRALRLDADTQLLWPKQGAAAAAVQEAIESTGVFVFHLAMPLDECRGASRWDASGPPAVLVNSSDSQSAQLFTLVHEYVHLALSATQAGTVLCDPSTRSGAVSDEIFANRVAAAVLVPRELLDLALPSATPSGSYDIWPASLRRQLQRTFHVSQDVIGIRLFHLEKAARPNWTKGFWRHPEPDSRGRSLPRAVKLARSFGPRTVRLARGAVDSEAVSPVELSRLLDEKVEDLVGALDLP